MKALYTKREYNNTATIVKTLPGDAGFVCSEKGNEKRWFLGIKVMDNTWDNQYIDGTEDVKPTAGFRR